MNLKPLFFIAFALCMALSTGPQKLLAQNKEPMVNLFLASGQLYKHLSSGNAHEYLPLLGNSIDDSDSDIAIHRISRISGATKGALCKKFTDSKQVLTDGYFASCGEPSYFRLDTKSYS